MHCALLIVTWEIIYSLETDSGHSEMLSGSFGANGMESIRSIGTIYTKNFY